MSEPHPMMSVPLLDLEGLFARQSAPIREAIDRVVRAQGFIMGPEVSGFEAEVSSYLGGGVSALGCSSGSAALVLALMALGVGPGDEVIVPPYSFFATASCVTLVGARPVWADIEPGSLNMDPAAVAGLVSARTKAVIAVHLFGRMADMAALREVVPARIPIVEDAAQALGARLDGAMACTLGEVSCVSFYPSKNLGAYGDGGLVVAREEALAARLSVLRRHGAREKYFHEVVGLNSRLDAIQAAVLRVKLPALDGWCEERRENAARYRALFAECGLQSRVTMPVGDGPGGRFHHIYNQFNVLVDDRDGLRAHLTRCGVGTAIYYPLPLHRQACFAEHFTDTCPVSDDAARRSLALPIFPGLSAAQQAYVVERVAGYYNGATSANGEEGR